MTYAVVLMEVCVIAMLAGWLWVVVAGGAWPIPWVILAASPLGLVSGRMVPFTWRRLGWFDAAWWGSVAIVVALLAEAGNQIAPGETSGARWNILFFAGLALAWRGWSLAEGWIDRELVESKLQAGIVVVLGVLLVLTWVSPGAGLGPAIVFVAAGLVGLSLARRAERRGPRAGLETDWLTLVGVMIALMLLVTVAVVALVTPDLLAVMVDQATAAGTAALGALAALAQWIGSLFPGVEPPPEDLRSGSGAPSGPLAPATPTASGSIPIPPFWVFELLYTFAAVVMIVVAARVLYRLLKSRPGLVDLSIGRRRDPPPAISEAPAFTWRSWWRVLWAWLTGRLAGGTSRAEAGGGRRAQQAAAPGEERSIRAMYRDFLAAVSRAGFERAPSTTPAELASEVGRARPAASRAVGALTDLYVRTRYGQERPGRDELSRMRAAVQQARRELAERRVEPPDSNGMRPDSA